MDNNEYFRELIDSDIDKIYHVFSEYYEKRLAEENNHIPPAIGLAFEDLAKEAYLMHGDQISSEKLGQVLASVFCFGQYAYKNGLKEENLTPCVCEARLTEEDISKLLNQK